VLNRMGPGCLCGNTTYERHTCMGRLCDVLHVAVMIGKPRGSRTYGHVRLVIIKTHLFLDRI